MRMIPYQFFMTTVLTLLIVWGCQKTQETPAPQQQPVATPAPTAPPPPPQPQPLSLFMVPLNPGEFSMQAIQANKKKIEEQPDDVNALVGLGDANIMISRYDVARDYYESALKVDAGHINANISLANCYLFLERPDDALSQLDKLLAISPDNPEALYNKGLMLLKSKQDQAGAQQVWTKLVQTHPENQLAQRVKLEMGN